MSVTVGELFNVSTKCLKLELCIMFAGQKRRVAKDWHAMLKELPWWGLCNSQSSNTICPTPDDIGRRGCIATRKIPHREYVTIDRSWQ